MVYNSLPARVGIFGQLLRKALWAPALIVLAALALAQVARPPDWWWLLHIAGGAAVALCYLRAIGIARPWLGELRSLAKYLLAFALACTTALAWEIGEFALDQVAGTTLQQGNFDTMSDLILSVVGAAAYLAFHGVRNLRTPN